jgi:hypothetical protein
LCIPAGKESYMRRYLEKISSHVWHSLLYKSTQRERYIFTIWRSVLYKSTQKERYIFTCMARCTVQEYQKRKTSITELCLETVIEMERLGEKKITFDIISSLPSR